MIFTVRKHLNFGKKTELKKLDTVYLRIILDYFQLLTITSNIKIQWPASYKDYM